jgi:hypothetical protein
MVLNHPDRQSLPPVINNLPRMVHHLVVKFPPLMINSCEVIFFDNKVLNNQFFITSLDKNKKYAVSQD